MIGTIGIISDGVGGLWVLYTRKTKSLIRSLLFLYYSDTVTPEFLKQFLCTLSPFLTQKYTDKRSNSKSIELFGKKEIKEII